MRTLSGASNFNATIHDGMDRDFFKFRTVAETSLAHSVSLDGDDIYSITLYDSDQNQLRSGLGSLRLEDLTPETDYVIEISPDQASPQIADYSLNFQLPLESAQAPTGGSDNNNYLSDWTVMVYNGRRSRLLCA